MDDWSSCRLVNASERRRAIVCPMRTRHGHSPTAGPCRTRAGKALHVRGAGVPRDSVHTLGADRQLEQERGVPLVERGQRFDGFTRDGERVLKSAQTILENWDGLQQRASPTTGSPASRSWATRARIPERGACSRLRLVLVGRRPIQSGCGVSGRYAMRCV